MAMARVTGIHRTDRPDRAHWRPALRPRGYQLIDRAIPYPARNLVSHATFVSTLDEAADLIAKGYAIRMSEDGMKVGDYIYPEDLRVTRA